MVSEGLILKRNERKPEPLHGFASVTAVTQRLKGAGAAATFGFIRIF
jgi:hypothetical protein